MQLHGTGTQIGDSVEVDVLSRVIRHHSKKQILISSGKTNLGHSGAVSGLTSIIKMSLALQHCLIPATIGVSTVNPALRLEERNAHIVCTNIPWPESANPRASVRLCMKKLS